MSSLNMLSAGSINMFYMHTNSTIYEGKCESGSEKEEKDLVHLKYVIHNANILHWIMGKRFTAQNAYSAYCIN